MKLSAVIAFALGARAADIPWQPGPAEEQVCADPVGFDSKPDSSPASWFDCASLYITWDYGKRGFFKIDPKDLIPGEYTPLVSYRACTIGITLLDGDEQANSVVKFGSEDIETLIEYAMSTFSEGTELSAHGTIDCDKLGREGTALLGWSFYDDTDGEEDA